jgi:hypothetical protein
MPREIPHPPRANRKGMSNLSMDPVRRVPNPKFHSRPFKATFPRRQPRVNSLQHPDLPPFKAVTNGPQKKVPVSQPLFAECKPLHLLRLPTPMTNALQRLLLLCRRPLRPRLAISQSVAISLPQPGYRKTRYRLQPQPRRHRPIQVLLFRILFHPSRSFPASALFEGHPTPRAPSARTFRLAA